MNTDQMEQRLVEHFPEAVVAVLDLTGTSNHFEVRIASSRLSGLTRIEQHKQVMAAFAQELKTGEVHALSIRVMAN